MTSWDVLDYFKTAPIAEARKALEYSTLLVAGRAGTPRTKPPRARVRKQGLPASATTSAPAPSEDAGPTAPVAPAAPDPPPAAPSAPPAEPADPDAPAATAAPTKRRSRKKAPKTPAKPIDGPPPAPPVAAAPTAPPDPPPVPGQVGPTENFGDPETPMS